MNDRKESFHLLSDDSNLRGFIKPTWPRCRYCGTQLVEGVAELICPACDRWGLTQQEEG
jgi:hypothetical protein